MTTLSTVFHTARPAAELPKAVPAAAPRFSKGDAPCRVLLG
jgi:hypothetical protein